jgi:hypothetical protein
MTDSVFRTAQEPEAEVSTPVNTDAKIESSVKVSVPDLLVSYEEDQGKPYTAKYFDVENMWNKEPTLKRDIKEIDGYLKELVAKGKLDNSTKAADLYIKELERKAGLSRYESSTNRISKILAYIDFKRFVSE